jgi:hypothetical protein
MTAKHFIVTALAIVWGASLSPIPAAAQEDPGSLINVRIIQVKAGKVPEFVDLQRKHIAARKEAGLSGRSVWQVVRGAVSTFQIVTPVENFADFDQPNKLPMSEVEWANWVSSLTDLIQSAQLVTLRTHPDLSIPPAEGSERNLLVLRYRTVGQGQNDEYHEWIRDKLVPGLRNGGVQGFSYARIVAGENPNMWVSASRIASWSQMDGPGPFAELSDRERNRLFSDGNALVSDSRNEVLRYRADLSD